MGIDGIEEVQPISLTEAYQLQKILDRMDVPDERKTDLQWLARNLGINNSEHPDFEEAMKLIRRLTRSSEPRLPRGSFDVI